MALRVIRTVALPFTAAICLVTLTSLSSVASAMAANTKAPFYSQVPKSYRSGITVAIQTDDPPLSEKAANGTETGEDPELFAALAKELGVPIHVEATSFDNELLGLDSGKYDFVGQTNITTAREKMYEQVAQFRDGYRFTTLASDPSVGKTVMSLCGKTIADEVGDSSVVWLQDESAKCTAAGKSAITVVQLPATPQEYVSVASGRAQLAIAPLSVTSYFLAQKGEQIGKKWKETGPAVLPLYAGYTFPKGSKLVTVIAKGVDALMKDGTYAKILTKNDLKGNIMTRALINPKPLPTT